MKICISALFILTISFAQQTWFREYGGPGQEVGNSVQLTLDGGYIVAGTTDSYGMGSDDFYLIKTDSLGDTIWTKTYGGTGSDQAFSVQQTLDGGYIVAGYTECYGAGGADFYLVKTDSSGDTMWTRTYGGEDNDYGSYVQQTVDGGYIITGTTYSFGSGGMDMYLVKTNANGDTIWTKTYGGTGSDQAFSVQQTLDGGYIVAGYTESYGMGNWDCYVVKSDSIGNTSWSRTYEGVNSDFGRSIQQTSDSGYVITGETYSFGTGSGDVYLVKTNADGDTMWTRTYGEDTDDQCGFSVQQTSDGGYVITGVTFFSFWTVDFVYIIKTDSSGEWLWSRVFGCAYWDSRGYSIQQTVDGGYIITGVTYFDPLIFLFKTDEDGWGPWKVEEEKSYALSSAVALKCMPNPFISFTRILGHEREDFVLFDVTGKIAGRYKGEKIGEFLPAGVYFVVSQNKTIGPLRIVKVR